MTCRKIKMFLDKHTGVNISSKKRDKHLPFYRMIYTYFCFKYCTKVETYKNISRVINRKPCNINYYKNNFGNEYTFNKDFKQLLNELECLIIPLVDDTIIKEYKLIEPIDIVEIRRHNMQLRKDKIKLHVYISCLKRTIKNTCNDLIKETKDYDKNQVTIFDNGA